MFKQLVNEAVLTVRLAADDPLLIRSGEANSLDPALPDMRFVRCVHNDAETVYLPGSSFKGVFRMRYEQLAASLKEPVCPLFDREKSCSAKLSKRHKNEATKDGEQRYKESCTACRLFGNLELGSHIWFTDGYPVGEVCMGMRNGVGIDRKTGSASNGALYDFEVVESGMFEFKIRFTNFARYQLALILEILADINNGYVSFGMGTSRGNGCMKVESNSLIYRYFGGDEITNFRGYDKNDLGGIVSASKSLLAYECALTDISAALAITSREGLLSAIQIEDWTDVLI